MFLTLKSNVYIVQGKCKSCIYDFNTRNLYHLEPDVGDTLVKLINEEENAIRSQRDKDLVTEFTENGLLEWSKEKGKRDIHDLAIEESRIDFAWIEITTKCNLFCIHCYDMASPCETMSMSWGEYEKVHCFIKQCGIKRIQFIGGEPLLCGDILKRMIREIRDDVEFLEVFTNATMIDERWAQFFEESKVHVAVSVYSYDANEHDKVTTVRESHTKTNRGIECLAKHNVVYRVCNVLMNDIKIGEKNTNLYKISERKDIVRMVGRGNMKLLSRDLLLKKIITEERFSMPLNLKLTKRLVSGHNCFGHKIYIATNGDVYPCVMERRWKFGNVNEDYEETLKAVTLKELLVAKDNISGCKECEFRYACFDCRPDSLGNDLRDKPWYCSYHPEDGRWEDADKFVDDLIKEYIDK